MTGRAGFWGVFAGLLLVAVYGFWSEGLFRQSIWEREGLVRLAGTAAGSAVWVIAVRLLAPRRLVCATLAAALAIAAIVVGIQAPLAALFLFASAWALGSLLALEGVLALLAGLAIYTFLIGFAVQLPVNSPTAYAAALAIPLLVRPPRGVLAALGQAEVVVAENLFAALLPGFVLLLHLLVALGPEVSADGLAMHLAIPASIHTHHRFLFDVTETTWALMPMAGDWAFTAAYLLGGEAAARLLNFGLLAALAALLYGLARRVLPPALSLVITALFASSPIVQLVTGSLFVENFWAAMLGGALAALVGYAESGRKRYALAAALLAGAAAAAKFGAVAYLAPLAVLLGWELRRRGALRLLPVAAGVVLLVGAPPYLKAWLRAGNPLFPFFNHVFQSPYFDSAAPLADIRFPPPAPLTALYDLTFRTARHFEGLNGGWSFLVFLWLPLALVVVRPRRDDPGWLALAFALPAAVVTLASQGNARYLYPALPLVAVAAASALARLRRHGGAPYRAALAATLAAVLLEVWFLPASGAYHKRLFVLSRSEREQYLAVSAPGRRVVAWLNERHPGAPAAFVESSEIAGLAGPAFTTSWHHYRFLRGIAAAGSEAECFEFLQARGIRLLVAPADHSLIPYVALRRLVTRFTDPEFSYGAWEVRSLRLRPPDGSPPLSPGRYDDLDSRLPFSGPWESGRFPAAAQGSVTYSNSTGAALRVAFHGARITWVYTKAHNRGRAEVRLNGMAAGVVDLYAAQTHWQARTSFPAPPGPGPHVFEIRVLGLNSPSSTGAFIDLDELIIE